MSSYQRLENTNTDTLSCRNEDRNNFCTLRIYGDNTFVKVDLLWRFLSGDFLNHTEKQV